MTERHVLGLSGGRDSAALAVYMRQNHPEIDAEYFFTDTGKELPEVYDFLGRLEGFLGKPILRLNPDRNFDFWLTQYKSFLPSPKTRWCTRQLKIRPFEEWVRPALARGDVITSYVAIRSDEDYREGYTSTHPNLKVRLPFRESGIDKAGVIEILEASGVGLPTPCGVGATALTVCLISKPSALWSQATRTSANRIAPPRLLLIFALGSPSRRPTNPQAARRTP